MELKYDAHADAASVLMAGSIEPGGNHYKGRLDADRFVRYSEKDECILEYEFLNVRRYGVRLDDLEHGDELRALFREAGFEERDWGHPIPTRRLDAAPPKTAAIIARWRRARDDEARRAKDEAGTPS